MNHLIRAGAIATLVMLSACGSVPITGRNQLNLLPESDLMGMSLTEYQGFLKENPPLPPSDQRVAMVRGIGQRLAKASADYLAGVSTMSEIDRMSAERPKTGVFLQRYAINPVNDAPTASNLDAGETYTEDTTKNLVDIVVSDVDSATVTATLTLSNAAAGVLTTATSGSTTSTFGSGVWSAMVMSKGGLSAGAATICETIWSHPPTVSAFVPYFSLNGAITASRKLSS